MMPDNIIWHNMGVTWWEKLWRSCLLVIVGMAVLLFSIILSIQIQGYLNYLQERYVATDECPKNITKLQAISDYKSLDTGLIHCFCQDEIFEKKNLKIMQDNFSDVYPGYK